MRGLFPRTTPVWPLLLSVLVAASLLGGCASYRAQPSPAAGSGGDPALPTVEPHWWHLRFRLHRAAPAATASYLDGMIAVEVIAPLLARHEREMA